MNLMQRSKAFVFAYGTPGNLELQQISCKKAVANLWEISCSKSQLSYSLFFP